MIFLLFVIRVSFSPEEVGDHTLKLSLKHKDLGNDVLPPLELTTQTVINDGRYSSINLPLNAQSVTFDSKGTYICNVSVDDNKLVLTINRQPISEWFKEQWKKLRRGLRQSE